MFQDNNAWINVIDYLFSKNNSQKEITVSKEMGQKFSAVSVLTIVDHTKWKAGSRVEKKTNRRRIEVKNL